MLSRAIDSYLAIRRATGFQMKVQGGLLRHFARYAADRFQIHVCRQTAIDWAAQAPSPYQRENRLSSVRLFARHARAEDARHDLIPRQVFAGRRRRTFPTILSPVELCQLLEATACLRPRDSLRPHTYYTLFGLLAATGLRISEAMHLRLHDVTADGLLVRMTKFRKNRLVPLHPTTVAALERYLEQRNAYAVEVDHVFISTTGQPLSYAMVNGTFRYLVRSIPLQHHPDLPQTRIHDLRHGFAVRALERCHGPPDDIARHTLALSTYLGHAHVTDTYWYLQITPQLTRQIADACAAREEGEVS
jgi:site-specific recombinase XerD